jgi:hypothetical protein
LSKFVHDERTFSVSPMGRFVIVSNFSISIRKDW